MLFSAPLADNFDQLLEQAGCNVYEVTGKVVAGSKEAKVTNSVLLDNSTSPTFVAAGVGSVKTQSIDLTPRASRITSLGGGTVHVTQTSDLTPSVSRRNLLGSIHVAQSTQTSDLTPRAVRSNFTFIAGGVGSMRTQSIDLTPRASRKNSLGSIHATQMAQRSDLTPRASRKNLLGAIHVTQRMQAVDLLPRVDRQPAPVANK